MSGERQRDVENLAAILLRAWQEENSTNVPAYEVLSFTIMLEAGKKGAGRGFWIWRRGGVRGFWISRGQNRVSLVLECNFSTGAQNHFSTSTGRWKYWSPESVVIFVLRKKTFNDQQMHRSLILVVDDQNCCSDLKFHK